MAEMRQEDIKIGVDVDTERLQDAANILEPLIGSMPDITIRDNQVVNVTINNFNATMQEYFKEDE